MKKIRYAALGMIICGCIAAAVGMAFLFSGSNAKRPEKNAETYTKEGDIYLDDEEYMKAIASYEKALELDDMDAEALRGSAKAYSSLAYYDEEETVRKRLAELEPDNLENWKDIVLSKINREQLDDAKSLLEELMEKYEDEDFSQLYHQLDIREPVFNLESGSYDSYQILELQEQPDNATVYYTLDGTEPDIYSDIYDEGIILSYPENVVKAVAIGHIGYRSDVVELHYQIIASVEEIERQSLSDSGLEWCIRDMLHKNWDEPIYNYEIAQIQSVYIIGQYNAYLEKMQDLVFFEDYYTWYESTYYERGQISLEILSYMPFLKTLFVGYQDSLDISVLANLESLEELSLLNDNIENIEAIGGLKKLKKLALGWNNISNVSPLAGLTELESLGLWNNRIQDVSNLSGLQNLYYFDIANNQVRDIGCVQTMPELSELWIAGNQISDFSPIDSCSNLRTLMLSGNPAGNYILPEGSEKPVKTDMQIGEN